MENLQIKELLQLQGEINDLENTYRGIEDRVNTFKISGESIDALMQIISGSANNINIGSYIELAGAPWLHYIIVPDVRNGTWVGTRHTTVYHAFADKFQVIDKFQPVINFANILDTNAMILFADKIYVKDAKENSDLLSINQFVIGFPTAGHTLRVLGTIDTQNGANILKTTNNVVKYTFKHLAWYLQYTTYQKALHFVMSDLGTKGLKESCNILVTNSVLLLLPIDSTKYEIANIKIDKGYIIDGELYDYMQNLLKWKYYVDTSSALVSGMFNDAYVDGDLAQKGEIVTEITRQQTSLNKLGLTNTNTIQPILSSTITSIQESLVGWKSMSVTDGKSDITYDTIYVGDIEMVNGDTMVKLLAKIAELENKITEFNTKYETNPPVNVVDEQEVPIGSMWVTIEEKSSNISTCGFRTYGKCNGLWIGSASEYPLIIKANLSVNSIISPYTRVNWERGYIPDMRGMYARCVGAGTMSYAIGKRIDWSVRQRHIQDGYAPPQEAGDLCVSSIKRHLHLTGYYPNLAYGIRYKDPFYDDYDHGTLAIDGIKTYNGVTKFVNTYTHCHQPVYVQFGSVARVDNAVYYQPPPADPTPGPNLVETQDGLLRDTTFRKNYGVFYPITQDGYWDLFRINQGKSLSGGDYDESMWNQNFNLKDHNYNYQIKNSNGNYYRPSNTHELYRNQAQQSSFEDDGYDDFNETKPISVGINFLIALE